MDDDYEKKNKQVKLHAFLICLCFFVLGSIAGTFFFFLYPNDILCDYTNNKYLCNKKICNKGYFGKDCLECKICINGYCDGSGTNSGSGKCICNKGWSGKLCDNCDSGFFGSNCTKCDDCINGLCDGSNTLLGSGKCICYNSYVGKNCDKCLDNYYGINCTNKCSNLLCLDSKCNEDGSCKKCIEGYEGLNCNKCDKFYKRINNKCILNTNISEICSLPDYGYSISNNKYGLCQSCPKNQYGLVCSGHGYCNGKGTVFGDGVCNCIGNYTGNLCQYYGIIVNLTKCDKNCNENGICLLYNNKFSCSCHNNYTGINCNECRVGFVKNKIKLIDSINKCVKCQKGSNYFGKYCQKCNCENGYCNDGFTGDGRCICNDGFIGPYCDICKQNYYGNNCTKCSDCNNKGICSDGKLGDGKCLCDYGYTGETCNKCISGFIKNNYHCEECPGSYGGKQSDCFGNGKCIIQNNIVKCNCKIGYYGKSCSNKIIGNCSNYNYCNSNGNCLDNECYCKNNFYGDYCNETYQSYLLKNNYTQFYLTDSYTIVKNDIENDQKKSSVNTGDALGISILSVFLFVGCFVGTAWYIKYKPNPIKNYATRLTASRNIELTEEEKKYCTINPILNIGDNLNNEFFGKAIKYLRLAVEKDNSHYFEEAINFYNLGVDNLICYMKSEVNANTRFQFAKKVDIYVKRANYLKKVLQNKELINEIQKAPLAPIY